MIELSIIIPTYNRAGALRRCLEALAQQTQPAADFEVIVVVDGATDHTREMLESLPTPYRLRVLWQENSGDAAARNLGVEAAEGRYCLFLDDDVVAAPALVAEHLRAQHEHPGAVGIGELTMTLPPGADWFARFFTESWQRHYARLNTGEVIPSWQDCYSGNLSMTRAAYLQAGGFSPDVRAHHDVDFSYRLAQIGQSFIYIPGATAEHEDYKGYRALAAQLERQGQASVHICRKHPDLIPALLGPANEMGLGLSLTYRLLLALKASAGLLGIAGMVLSRTRLKHRWCATVNRYFFLRGVRQSLSTDTWQRLTYCVPILMYHAFACPGEQASRYVMPVKRFAQQLGLLNRLGYHPLSLEEYLHCRRENELPPARSVIITIDDGYADNLELAYPILCAHKMTATFFVVSGYVGTTNRWEINVEGGGDDTSRAHASREHMAHVLTGSELFGRPLLGWRGVQELAFHGMQIGAHTRTHRALPSTPPPQKQAEVAGSRLDLERKLGMPVNVFAYPYGESGPQEQALVEQSGFLGAVGVHSARNTLQTPLYNLCRIEIFGTDSLFTFALKLWLGRLPRIFWPGFRSKPVFRPNASASDH